MTIDVHHPSAWRGGILAARGALSLLLVAILAALVFGALVAALITGYGDQLHGVLT